jgi:hypothetical protein
MPNAAPDPNLITCTAEHQQGEPRAQHGIYHQIKKYMGIEALIDCPNWMQ